MKRRKITPFYATHTDLIKALGSLKHAHPTMSFVPIGESNESEIERIDDVVLLKEATGYLVTFDGLLPRRRIVATRGGFDRFILDQLENPDSVVLRTCGHGSEHQLLAGSIGTTSGSNLSLKFYEELVSCLRTSFKKRHAYLIGNEANILLENGWRLSPTRAAAQEYDLEKP